MQLDITACKPPSYMTSVRTCIPPCIFQLSLYRMLGKCVWAPIDLIASITRTLSSRLPLCKQPSSKSLHPLQLTAAPLDGSEKPSTLFFLCQTLSCQILQPLASDHVPVVAARGTNPTITPSVKPFNDVAHAVQQSKSTVRRSSIVVVAVLDRRQMHKCKDRDHGPSHSTYLI